MSKSNTETIDGIPGEWRTVTKASEVKVWQRVRYTDCECIESNDIRFIYLKSDNVHTWDGKNEHIGTSNLFAWSLVQAFFPLPVKQKRKVAKVRIIDSEYSCMARIKICSWFIDIDYVSKKSALRGAQRFCKAIGWECEVVK